METRTAAKLWQETREHCGNFCVATCRATSITIQCVTLSSGVKEKISSIVPKSRMRLVRYHPTYNPQKRKPCLFLVWPDISQHFGKQIQYSCKKSRLFEYTRPAFVAKRLMESSASALALTCPHSAKFVVVDKALPSASTSTTAIWIEAWSLAVINRSIDKFH